MAKKVFLSLLVILFFSFNCIGQNVKSNLVKLDTKEMGIDKNEFDVEVVEIERNENISKLKIIDKTLTSVCSVITLQMMTIYKIAKVTSSKYFGSSVIPVEATRYSITKKKQKNDNLGDQAKVFEKYERK